MYENIVQMMDKVLKEYDRVLLIPAVRNNEEILPKLVKAWKTGKRKRKILFLTDMAVSPSWQDCVRHIVEENAKVLEKLYDTYEFSDRFIVLRTGDGCYGTLWNYVKTGLLTERECLQALLEDADGTAVL